MKVVKVSVLSSRGAKHPTEMWQDMRVSVAVEGEMGPNEDLQLATKKLQTMADEAVNFQIEVLAETLKNAPPVRSFRKAYELTQERKERINYE